MSREQRLEKMLLTIVDVTTSPDMKQATVYFSSLNKNLNIASTEKLLDEMAHTWHKTLGQRVRMKYIPRLHFCFDNSMERGDRILQILNELDDSNTSDKEDNG